MSANNSETRSGIVAHLERALAGALSSMTGKEFSVDADGAADAGETEDPIVWAQSFTFSPEPVLWLSAGKDFWTAVGRLTLAAVGIDSPTDEDCRSTWQEIVGQTVGSFASAVTLDVQQEVNGGKGEERLAEDGLDWIVLTAKYDDQVAWQVKVAWSKGLSAIYDRHDAPARPAQSKDSTFSKTFDLLLDVALPVSVSFGRTSLQIREVLKLNTGSIVELNRLVTEPVEVIVNDCVIARGEVVVVDGNYGVRVTHLASREDRLRSGIGDAPIKVAEALR